MNAGFVILHKGRSLFGEGWLLWDDTVLGTESEARDQCEAANTMNPGVLHAIAELVLIEPAP